MFSVPTRIRSNIRKNFDHGFSPHLTNQTTPYLAYTATKKAMEIDFIIAYHISSLDDQTTEHKIKFFEILLFSTSCLDTKEGKNYKLRYSFTYTKCLYRPQNN